MRTTDLEVATPDGPMALHEAVPDGPPKGAVVVVQEAFGVNDHIRDVAGRVAGAGYHAVAPAYFHRAGGGTIEDYTQTGGLFALFEGLTDDGILMDTDAALAHLHANGFGDAQIGVVGFCFGGRVSFLVALERALGASVGFYGGGIASKGVLPFPSLETRVGELRTPWLGLFGDEDPSIPVDDVERLRGELASAPVPCEVVRYAGAQHGFHCDARASYHEASARDAWTRTLAWFGEHLA